MAQEYDNEATEVGHGPFTLTPEEQAERRRQIAEGDVLAEDDD